MLNKERQQKILEVLHRDGKVIVKDLSTDFQVTEDCIRKDLKVLEQQNVLERTYGGAVLIRKTAAHHDIRLRSKLNVPSKQVIAQKAAALLTDHETVFLDISTTNLLLTEELAKSKKKLTIVSNMLEIISIINKTDNQLKAICTGGVLCKELDGFTGSMAIEIISRYRPTKCFIGSCGINILDKSITTFDVEDGNTKKAIIAASKEVFVVMENEKFGIDGTYSFATLHDIDAIITEALPDKDIIQRLAKTNIKVI